MKPFPDPLALLLGSLSLSSGSRSSPDHPTPELRHQIRWLFLNCAALGAGALAAGRRSSSVKGKRSGWQGPRLHETPRGQGLIGAVGIPAA